jgi:hypothetical protein
MLDAVVWPVANDAMLCCAKVQEKAGDSVDSLRMQPAIPDCTTRCFEVERIAKHQNQFADTPKL